MRTTSKINWKPREQLEESIKASGVGLWDLNLQTNEAYHSPEWKKQIGYEDDELQSSFEIYMSHLHPNDAKRIKEIMKEYLSGKRDKFECEYRFRHKDGSYRWILARSSIQYDKSGKPWRLLGSHLDITERKLAENAMLKLKEQYHLLVESAPDIIFMIANDSTFTALNPAFETFSSWKPEEWIGKPFAGLIHPDDIPLLHDLFQRAMQGEEPPAFESRILTKQGNYLFFEFVIKLVLENGEVKGLIGISRPITERKKAEEKINMLAYAVKNSVDCIAITDKDYKFIFTNDSFCKTFSFKEDEIIGQKVSMIYSENNLPEVIKDLFSTIEGKKNWSGEILNKRKDGNDFPVQLSLSPLLNDKGELFAIVSVIRDITEQKQREAEIINLNVTLEEKVNERTVELLTANSELIIARDKAEQNDRLKTAFLNNMSHEIRTPMNGILGFSDLLKSEDTSEEERHIFIEMIEQGGKRLLNIINSLLEISKIESGVTEAVHSSLNLNERLDYIYNFFKPEVTKLGMKLVVKTGLPFEAATIVSDGEMLVAILTNMVKNAIKYSDTGTIEFGYYLNSTDNQKVVQFYVKDTGIGISPKDLEIIFNRFDQAGNDSTRLREGNGLGLSIAKAYVELLGGKIWVESVLGEGSSFYFTLPYNTESATTAPDKEMNPQEKIVSLSKKLNILIVEDDELSEKLLTRILQTQNQKILYAKTAEEAITICRNNPDLDLVLMDIKLPEKDGLFASQQIREFNKKIIIIAQTAYVFNDEKAQALAAGCDDYITKPLNKKMLLEMIHNYF